MFESILKFYLKRSGNRHLISFIYGLTHLGRPSSILFPTELLQQGLSLILSGLNNTMTIQSNFNWVWPFWVEQQQDPDSGAFIPTGVNLLTANLTYRNWVSLGIIGSKRESMIDPVGMLTLRPFSWSVFPYLITPAGRFLPPRLAPAVTQYLREGYLPEVITEYWVSPDLRWFSEALALEEEGEELTAFSHHLENTGRHPLQVTLGLAIRPYNALTMGHINKLKLKNRLWRVNRKPALLLFRDPDRAFVSDRHLGDPLKVAYPGDATCAGISKSGVLAGIAEFDIRLAPGEKQTIETLGLLGKTRVRPNTKFQHLTSARVKAARDRTREYWRVQARTGMTLSLPDKSVERAFLATKNHLHVFDDQDHFTPGSFFYHGHWIRDSAFIALAFENLGYSDRVTGKIPGYLRTQTWDGFFKSQNGEWDSAGQALFTMVQHTRRNGRLDLLEKWFPAMLRAVRWIETMCRKTTGVRTPHMGLLPAGFSAEHFGPNDHYFWDNFWALAGVKNVLWAAGRLCNQQQETRLRAFYEEYRHALNAALAAAQRRSGGSGLPCSPYRELDSAAIGNLVAIAPLDLFSPSVSWLKPTVSYLIEKYLRDGLFFQRIIHTGLNPYLSVQLARALLALDDERWWDILKALLVFGRNTFTWPEAIHPLTRGGCMGDGDHGWAAAECINLIRDMLLREQDGRVFLAAGIPSDWRRPGMKVVLENGSSPYGDFSFTLEQNGEALRLAWSITRNQLQDRVPVYLVVPDRFGSDDRFVPYGQGKVQCPLTTDRGTLTLTPPPVVLPENLHPQPAHDWR